jgi:hypothetical protein
MLEEHENGRITEKVELLKGEYHEIQYERPDSRHVP